MSPNRIAGSSPQAMFPRSEIPVRAWAGRERPLRYSVPLEILNRAAQRHDNIIRFAGYNASAAEPDAVARLFRNIQIS